MKDRVANKPGRILITPENGSAPFYATITRADEPLQEGDALSKANLLKDQTAARFGKGSDSVPDTIFDQIANELDRYSHAQAGGVQIKRGSYIGDGKFGANNKNRLDLEMNPMVVFISREDQCSWGFFLNPSPFGFYTDDTLQEQIHVEWNGGEIAWYSSFYDSDAPSYSPMRQLNADGATYYYVAIGLGNTGLDWDRLDEMTLLVENE